LELPRQLIAGSQIRPAVERPPKSDCRPQQIFSGDKAFDIVLELFPAPPTTIMVSQIAEIGERGVYAHLYL
jgi:hypothetical protein